MKNLSFFLAVLFLFSILAVTGCKGPCEDVVCENNGVKKEVDKECECECEELYEGERCELRVTSKFVGSYVGNSECVPHATPVDDDFVIAESQNYVERILINNSGQEYYGEIVEVDSFRIPKQNKNFVGFDYEVSGGGKINGTEVTLYLDLKSSSVGNGSCKIVGVRQ